MSDAERSDEGHDEPPHAEGGINVTLLSLAGEVVAKRMVRVGSTAGDLQSELAQSLGFAISAVSFVDGPVNLPDSHACKLRPGEEVAPVERSLTCVLATPRPSRRGMMEAIKKRQHGAVRAMLRAAAAPRRLALVLLLSDDRDGDEEEEEEEEWEESEVEVNEGDTALHLAAKLDAVSVLEVLVEQAEGVLELFTTTVRGETVLHAASVRGNTAAMRLLLRAAGPLCGRLLLAKGPLGATALHPPGRSELAELLLTAAEEHGVLRQLLLAQGHDGGTALHWAVSFPVCGPEALWAMVTAAKGAGLARELQAIRDRKGRSLAELAEESEDEEVRSAIASLAAAS